MRTVQQFLLVVGSTKSKNHAGLSWFLHKHTLSGIKSDNWRPQRSLFSHASVKKPEWRLNSPGDQVFAAGLLANTSSPVNRTLQPVLLGGVGTEHATFHTQSPAKAQWLSVYLCWKQLNVFFKTLWGSQMLGVAAHHFPFQPNPTNPASECRSVKWSESEVKLCSERSHTDTLTLASLLEIMLADSWTIWLHSEQTSSVWWGEEAAVRWSFSLSVLTDSSWCALCFLRVRTMSAADECGWQKHHLYFTNALAFFYFKTCAQRRCDTWILSYTLVRWSIWQNSDTTGNKSQAHQSSLFDEG